MAIINNGPLTNGIRGKVGDLIFQMVNGVQIVRSMPASIQDPNTPLQQIQRSAFAQAVQEWRELDVQEREKWNFQASLRGNLGTHRAARRVDGTPKPTNGTKFDGHNSTVAQKSREADKQRAHGQVTPLPIGLQSPPPYAKTRNLPPAHIAIIIAVGSLGAAWNPDPLKADHDGLWWYYSEPVARTLGSTARAWVQPPYPIHSQRITIDDATVTDWWGEAHGLVYDGFMWAWKCQVKDSTIRIVEPAEEPNPASVNIPYVWKSQMDFVDAQFLDTKGSGVVKFYLPADLGEGLWLVWPTFFDLLA